jgi:hypothetical protein
MGGKMYIKEQKEWNGMRKGEEEENPDELYKSRNLLPQK